MKKKTKQHLFLVLLLFTLSSAKSQVSKFRAFQTAYWTTDTKTNELEWKDTDILVVLNTDKDQIRIFAQKEKQIDIIEKFEKTQTKDGDENFKYMGVDEAGLKVKVELVIFKDDNNQHKATIILAYKDVSFVYRLKNN